MSKDRVGSAMGGSKKSKSKPSKKKAGKHLHEMHIRHSANGGYIAKHIAKPQPGGGPQPDPQEHTLGDMNDLTQHVQDNMQQPPPGAMQQQPMQQAM